MMAFKRGTIEYWEVFRGDAERFAFAAHRLRGYQRALPWWGQWISAFVIGFLDARAKEMIRHADAETKGTDK